MLHILAIFLIAAPIPVDLTPEAGEHNASAMRFYDAGQLGPAVDEFYAAYRLMPDARRDRAGRELLLGSMRSTLLDMHAATGEAAPLCRLQAILKEHVDALMLAYPDDPGLLETRSARARHEEVTADLAALPDDACEPPPPAPAALPVLPSPTPAPAPRPTPAAAPTPTPANDHDVPPRHLRIAGGVTLGLGAGLLGVMTYGLITEGRQRAYVADIADKPADCPLTPDESDDLRASRERALVGRQLAIGTGAAALVTTALGVTLFALARRSARAKRWSAAPWWTPSGAGLTLHVKLRGAR